MDEADAEVERLPACRKLNEGRIFTWPGVGGEVCSRSQFVGFPPGQVSRSWAHGSPPAVRTWLAGAAVDPDRSQDSKESLPLMDRLKNKHPDRILSEIFRVNLYELTQNLGPARPLLQGVFREGAGL